MRQGSAIDFYENPDDLNTFSRFRKKINKVLIKGLVIFFFFLPKTQSIVNNSNENNMKFYNGNFIMNTNLKLVQ